MNLNSLVNERILSPFVTVILEDGTKHGNVTRETALGMAREKMLDLVMVSPASNNKPPVCKLMDYGKAKYREAKQHKQVHHNDDVKEVHFGFKIASHDLDTKMRKVHEILGKKRKVRLVLELTGREKQQTSEAMIKFTSLLEPLNSMAAFAPPTLINGKKNIISTTLSPR